MEENGQPGKVSKSEQAFLVKASIDERGPQELKVVPSYHQYLIYQDNSILACIQKDDEGGWEQIEGKFSDAIITVIGQAIQRTRNP